MSDPVAIALIATIVPTVTSIVGLVVSVVTRRNVNTLTDTVKQEGLATRNHVQTCCHPDDLPPRASSSARPGLRS